MIIHFYLFIFTPRHVALDVNYLTITIALAPCCPLALISTSLPPNAAGDGFKLAPRSLDIAEGITFFIFLADEWLYSWLALALALELPEELAGYWCHDGICLGMLELCKLCRSKGCTELGILCLLKVSQEVLLCLSALVVAILLWVHSELEEFLVVLTVIPTVLVHLLLEVVEGVGEQCEHLRR